VGNYGKRNESDPSRNGLDDTNGREQLFVFCTFMNDDTFAVDHSMELVA